MTETAVKRWYARGLRSHFHLLRVLGFLLGILLLIGWGLVSLERSPAGQGLDSSKWQWASASSFQEAAPPDQGWIPLSSRPDLHNESRYYWLRIPLAYDDEAPLLREPTLWVFNTPSLRVFDRGNGCFPTTRRSGAIGSTCSPTGTQRRFPHLFHPSCTCLSTTAKH
ncbi:hypothetical protein [Cohnella faecalis]|uniref:Uncharacterized protein n=1 Tax=Cohnella faecalis TaxID=2315694 RepID=A0A398CIJ9_9BACL|nr:hypothetical protein [Cohnella faecalis]RIE02205.1 hypothetical protein D3H35_15810 [Cohnella faecalis]